MFPHLTVEENIRYGQHGRSQETIDPIVSLLGLQPFLKSGTAGLSGGERQRVALARALAAKATLLLLDEPLASLDVERRDSILPYLARIRDELALPMLYVSHQADELAALCDDVLVLEEGKVVDQGAPSQVFVKQTVVAHRRKR